eukprot:764977-Hanusia_phi.AAC.2
MAKFVTRYKRVRERRRESLDVGIRAILSLHGKCFSVLDTAKVASLLVKPTIVCPTLIQGKRDGEATESHKEAVDALLFLSASKTSSGTQAVGSDNIENRKRASEDETPSQSHPTCNSAPDAGRGGKKAKTLEQEFEWSSSQPSAIPRGSYKCSRCGKPKRGHRCNLPESHMQTVFKQAQQPNKLVTESKKAPVAVLPAHPLVQVPVLGQFSASSKLQNVDPNSSVAADALASKKNYKVKVRDPYLQNLTSCWTAWRFLLSSSVCFVHSRVQLYLRKKFSIQTMSQLKTLTRQRFNGMNCRSLSALRTIHAKNIFVSLSLALIKVCISGSRVSSASKSHPPQYNKSEHNIISYGGERLAKTKSQIILSS